MRPEPCAARHGSLQGLRSSILCALFVLASCGTNDGRSDEPPRDQPPAERAHEELQPTTELPAPIEVPPFERYVMPEARSKVMSAFSDGRLFVIGGDSTALSSRVDVWSPSSNTWTRIADLPAPRRAGRAVVVDDRIVVVTGENAGGLTAAVDVLDIQSLTWSAASEIPTPRSEAAAVAFEGRIWVIGGHRPEPGLELDNVEIFDPRQGGWSAGPPLPRPARGSFACVIEGTLHLFGGFGAGRRHLVLEGDRWIEAAPLPTEKSGARALVSGGSIYIVGGRPGLRDLIVFDSTTSTYRQGPIAPESRDHDTSEVIDGRLVRIGGSRDTVEGATLMAQIDVFDIATDQWWPRL